MVRGVQEDFAFCSPVIFFRKTKQGALYNSTTLSQWEHPYDNWNRPDSVGPSTIGKQQQFSKLNKNMKINSKLPNSLTTTIPTFDGKSKKIERFEDLFQISLKTQNQFTEKKNKLFPLSHGRWCATHVWKHQWPEQREFGRKFDCVLQKMHTTEMKNNQGLSTHPVRPLVKTNFSTEKCYFGANAAKRTPPTHRNRKSEGQNQVQQRNNQNSWNENARTAAQTLD